MTVRVVGSRIKTNRTNMQEPDTLSSQIITYLFRRCKRKLPKMKNFFDFFNKFLQIQNRGCIYLF